MAQNDDQSKPKVIIAWAGGSYRGELREGKPHGKGDYKLPDGTLYSGDWFNGIPHGQGQVQYFNGGIYRGAFFNGKRHGQGIYRLPDGRELNGFWENGQFSGSPSDSAKPEHAEKSIVKEQQFAPPVIEIKDLSFQYKSGKGIFDLSFNVGQGEVFGYLGPNGSGKTTTIRHLLGFTRPGQGGCTIEGLDCWADAAIVQKKLGYLPGEIAFLEEMSGMQFLNLMGDLRGTRGSSRRDILIERFELDPSGRIRRMSKGMKQKLGIVTAFMHDPDVYVLDEPTSGLDPLMQNTFIDLILEEKERGKTILMSSHNFEETYRTCDRAGIIKEGRLVAVEDVNLLKTSQRKAYLVTLEESNDLEHLRSAGLEIGKISKNTVEVFVSGNYDQLIAALANYRVLGLDVVSQSLEQVFLKYYGREARA